MDALLPDGSCEDPVTSDGDEPLDRLLSRVTNENRHGLIDWGPPVGKEWGAEVPDQPEGITITQERLGTLHQRSAAYQQNPAAAIPLDEALARIERLLNEATETRME